MNQATEIVVVPLPTNKRFQNLTGQKFGRLTVLAYAGLAGAYQSWFCKCECGTEKALLATHIKRGLVKSCGCYRVECGHKKNLTHGKTAGGRTPEYRAWKSMRDRCLRPKNKAFHNYGGRGIKVCDRWLNSFENFLEDMGLKPSPQHSIDRLENDGNYEKGNCAWRTKKEQSRNTRRNRVITLWGFSGIVNDVAEHFNISLPTLKGRVTRNLMHLYPAHPPCASAPDGA